MSAVSSTCMAQSSLLNSRNAMASVTADRSKFNQCEAIREADSFVTVRQLHDGMDQAGNLSVGNMARVA